MALLGVLSQDDGMSVVLLLFVTLFVPVLLWHKESQKEQTLPPTQVILGFLH